MEQTKSRWFYIFLALSIAVGFLFPPKVFADTNWIKYFRSDSLLNKYKSCYAVFDGCLWVGTKGDGIIVYNSDGSKVNYTNKNTRTAPELNDGLPEDNITCISVDSANGKLWIGTINGVAQCGLDGKNWVRYSTKQGLPNEFIRDIGVDKFGYVWVGTPSGVAVSTDGERFVTFTHEAATGSVHSLKIQDDVVWVGNVSGLVGYYKDGSWKTVMSY